MAARTSVRFGHESPGELVKNTKLLSQEVAGDRFGCKRQNADQSKEKEIDSGGRSSPGWDNRGSLTIDYGRRRCPLVLRSRSCACPRAPSLQSGPSPWCLLPLWPLWGGEGGSIPWSCCSHCPGPLSPRKDIAGARLVSSKNPIFKAPLPGTLEALPGQGPETSRALPRALKNSP